jgi:predicted nucleic acid-binding protein
VVLTAGPWLIDKSALARLAATPDHTDWNQRIERGLVRIATVTLLEVGYSARSANEHHTAISMPPISLMPVEHLTPAAEDRTVGVQRLLAARGQHRAPFIPDLLIAAIAERARCVVLHMDKDFELISQITGQPAERLH